MHQKSISSQNTHDDRTTLAALRYAGTSPTLIVLYRLLWGVMHQSYQGSDRPSQLPAQSLPAIPQPVATAVKLMYAGAVVSLIGIGLNLTTAGSARSRIAAKSPSLTPVQVTDAVHAEVGVFIALGLIGAAFWLWMSRSCRAGKGWARIVSTVLFAVATISIVLSVTSAGGLAFGSVTKLYELVGWLIGLAAIILLWQRVSSDYFNWPDEPA
jgi:hypothetical protein